MKKWGRNECGYEYSKGGVREKYSFKMGQNRTIRIKHEICLNSHKNLL